MVENGEKIAVTSATLYRIIDHLNYPGQRNISLRTKADVLIEDAIARRAIAKAGKALGQSIEKGEI